MQAQRTRNLPGQFSQADEEALFKSQKGLCRFFEFCGTMLGDKYHRDHIVPMAKGGTHWPSNRQLLCADCNTRKGTKDQAVFLIEIGLAGHCALLVQKPFGQFSHP